MEIKTLHILPMNKLSGAEKVALLTAKNLVNCKAVVVCGGSELEKNFKKENIETYKVDFQQKNKISIIKELRKIMDKENIDIIHAHDNTASIYSYIAKSYMKKDIKIISHIHNCYPWLKENGINKKIDSFFRKRYNKNIVCGKLVYDFYMENTDYLKDEKTEIISNAIDTENIENQEKDINMYEQFKISKDKKIIGFIGRMDKQKGLTIFIKELLKHKEKFEDCVFLLVGNGAEEQEIKKIIKENNLENLIICAGFQEEIYRFYPIIDIFFLPSLYEGLPMVILEAMAFEKCVVAMDVGSIFEVIKNDETGILIKNDIREFVYNLEKIKDDKEKIKKLGENAKEKIVKNYSIEQYVKRIEEIYLKTQKG